MWRFAARSSGRLAAAGATAVTAPSAAAHSAAPTPPVAPGAPSTAPQARSFAHRTPVLRAGASPKKDYYETLGVSKSADEKQIKSAYRKLAMKTHPDQGGSKEEFAAVSEAYAVLSSPEKRQAYDQFGHDGPQNMGGPGGMGGFKGAEDIFKEFFGGRGRGGGGRGHAQAEDVQVVMPITLEDINNGATKQVRVKRTKNCVECRGEGTSSPSGKQKCSTCHGEGQVMQRIQMGPGMVQQMVSACPKCNGKGSIIRPEHRCKGCRGEGVSQKHEEISVTVPKGVPSGATLVMQGMGSEHPGAVAGDLQIQLEEQRHARDVRKGDDLFYTHRVSLPEALLGTEIRLPMLDGRVQVVRSEKDKPMRQGSVLSLPGQGLPRHQASGKGGVYIVIDVRLPERLTEKQRAALSEAFGTPASESTKDTPVKEAKLLQGTVQELEAQKEREWANHGQAQQGPRGGRGGMGGGQQQQCQTQ